ncbi:hypothetical protein [Streptomyces sennicomposti]|uniref:hypothetical protein n=1 Tax=Streptomyces sennicomposti TaxID=2873384 RepID=UPI001CA6661B|nr:hypothetical protein [Streptomyces sennicomposti]MBY8864478.1 hypothetical protein [Streptomyces sennicomposti]
MRECGCETRGTDASDDAVQLERRIRFALSVLGESNSHHEFEALCLGLARRRITSNLLPATGPVSSGGDQGRDAESHWTDIPRELPGTSLFASLASTQRVVMACTIQAAGVPGKIRRDLASICGQGTPVDRVIYFTVTAVPAKKRHDLIDEAARTHQVDLEIWDAAALALHLADYDLFYLAVQYLHLPSDLAPSRPDGAGELPDWYVEACRRWRASDEPACTLGDLVDLRAPLRHATSHKEARADLPEWIGYARALLAAAAGKHTALRARYEIVVATLRGLGDMHSTDQLACEFFGMVTVDDTLTDPGILEDAVMLLQYGFGALARSLTALTADDLCRWQRLLTDKIDCLLDADPPANAMAHLLAMRARLALHADMTADFETVPEDLPTVAEVTAAVVAAVEAGEPIPALQSQPPITDLDTGMKILLRLGHHLDNAPMFPIERTADLFDYLTPVLVDHPLYREVRDLLDKATDRVTGQTARGERAQSRGHALIKSGRLPQALQEIHEAKVNWLRGDTLEGGLTMLLLCARLYSELGLPIAAKQYALAAAAAAKTGPGPELNHYVPRSIILAAQYDRQAGNWISATRLFCIGLMAQNAYCDEPYNPERYPYVWEMMADQALTLRIASALRPGFVSLIRVITASVGIDTLIDDLLAPTADSPTATEETYTEEADVQGMGRPFSDAGPTRRCVWNALGVDWEITCPNEHLSVLAAERYTAALQVFLGELATQDPLFLPGRVSVEIHADANLPHDQPAACHHSAERDINRWRLRLHAGRLPAGAPADLETEPSRLLTVLIKVVLSQSLLSDEAFMHLVEQALAGGLWHKLLVGRPYDELADFLEPEIYQTMAVLADPAVGAGTPQGQANPAALPARTGPGPGYEHKGALDAVRSRYAVMLPIVRHTLPRLSADPAFRHRAMQLREEGWRDWHLLTAIANAVGNHRARQQGLHPFPGDSPEHRARILAAMQAPERPDDPPVPAEAFTESALRTHLSVAAVSTAHSLGLVVRHGFLDRQALLSVLGDRYGYWTNDVEHDDPFDWPAAEDVMTIDQGRA